MQRLEGPGYYMGDHEGPAILVDGAREIFLDHLFVTAGGEGLQVTSGGCLRLDHVKINSASHALHLTGQSGLWANSCHLNNTKPGTWSNAILVDGGWDTLYLTDVLTEEFLCGIRLGSPAGSIGNSFASNLTLDRVQVGIHMEPSGTGEVRRMQFRGVAINAATGGGIVPVNVDSRGTTGSIAGVRISGDTFDFANKTAWLNGPLDSVLLDLRHF